MNNYCGPFALGYVLGIDSDQAEQKIRDLRGSDAAPIDCDPSKPVTCVWSSEIADILRGAGKLKDNYFLYRTSPYNRPTLAQWLRLRDPKLCYIVLITNHFIVVKGNKIFDNMHRSGITINAYPHRRKRMRRIFEIKEGESNELSF